MASVGAVIGTVRGGVARGVMRLPAPLLRAAGGAPVVVDGKRLDHEMQLLLRLARLEGPAVEEVSVSRGRRILRSSTQMVGGTPTIGAVTDRVIDGPGGSRLGLRFYTPRDLAGASPALVFFHGGGWIYGDLDSHDALCRFLAEAAQVRVVAVDYRLAPEAQFPAAVDDAWAAWEWVRDRASGLGIDPARIAVGGDSAGGNLAAVVAQRAAREQGQNGNGGGSGNPQPAFQLLIYPATDFAERSPSRHTFGEGFYLTTGFMDKAEENYLAGDEDRTDPRLSPLHGDVSGVAPAYLVTAGFDPLLDEGRAYAEKMQSAGVPVEYRCEEGLIHGFANMVSFGRSAPAAIARIAAALHRGLS
ncbi:MAG: alpha/beta hydrolase [Aeromicrobium sp.]|uniref:alpha/beta hydrolase n=1 Tax=Aeromicrobium sp. TaxID=1871063 RepID=UPI0025B95531|nr:alpha/beta hydrolase [Aeromicrobium sp.]MDF1704433.1 alpha/beta hydrolase [Aeromicrobium sp.]